jgi:hypothetical protein
MVNVDPMYLEMGHGMSRKVDHLSGASLWNPIVFP